MDTLKELQTKLHELGVAEIRARIDELEAEQRQLAVLLRAAQARERHLNRRKGGAECAPR